MLPSRDDLPDRRRTAWALWLVACLARSALAARWDVLPDEAYYWSWGQQPAWGYFDHPPLLAWLLAPMPATPWAVRCPGWLLTSIGGAALIGTSRRPRTLAALLAVLPPLWLFGTLATPDAPLLGWWMLALAAVRSGRWVWWGPLVGLAALTKYPGLALLALGAALPRAAWRSPALWAGALSGAALCLPHGLWSVTHHHPALAFQADHGLGGGTLRGWGPLAVFAEQVGLSGGLLGLAAPFVLWHHRGSPAWWATVPVVAVFGAASLFAPSEANWLAPAWVGLAALLAEAGGRARRVVQTGVWLALLVSAVAVVHVERPLWPTPTDPALRLATGRAFADTAAKFVLPAPSEPARPVWTERYQEASWLRWHHTIDAGVWAGCGRPNQLDGRASSDEAWFVRPRTGGPPTCVMSDWAVVERRGFEERARDGRFLGAWDVFLLRRL